MVSSLRVAPLCACDRYGGFSAVLGPDGGISIYDMSSGARLAAGTEACGLHDAPISALAIAPKRGRVAARADRAGNILLGACHGSLPVPILADPPRPVVLDASDNLVIAAGGAANELVAIPLRDAHKKRAVDVVPDFTGVRRFPLAHLHRSVISAAAIVPGDSSAIVCCQAISVVDLKSGMLLQKFAGHQTPVTAIALLPRNPAVSAVTDEHTLGRNMFITACAGDQFLCIWNIPNPVVLAAGTPPAAKKRRKDASGPLNALHTFTSPEKGVQQIIVDHHDNESSTISLAALLPSGSIAVWKDWDMNAPAKTIKVSFVIRPSPSDFVLFATFPKPSVLAVGRGHTLRPELYSISLAEVRSPLVDMGPSNTKGLLAAESGKDSAGFPANAILAKAEARTSRPPQDAAFGSGAVKGKSSNKPKAAATSNGHLSTDATNDKHVEHGGIGMDHDSAAASESEPDDGDDAEPTFEEKLARLGVPVPSGAAGHTVSKPHPEAGPVGNVGSADSFANVIAQAIRAKDDKLLDSVLSSASKITQVRQSISRMPVDLATNDFLDALVTRLVHSPRRSKSIVPWLRELLLEHASTLMNRRRSPQLDQLMNAILARVEALPALTRLEGRLELIVAQADRVRSAKKNFIGNSKPAVQYSETVVAENVNVGAVSRDDSSEEEEDADETGDFSEDDSDSSTWEGEEDDEDDVDDEANAVRSGKRKGSGSSADMSDSEDDDEVSE